MHDTTLQRDAILRRLLEPSSALRTQGVELLVDFALDQPVESFLNPTDFAQNVCDLLCADNVKRFQTRHGRPFLGRLVAAWAENEETPQHGMTGNAVMRLEKIMAGDDFPVFPWIHGAIEPALLRQIISPILQEILIRFAQKLPIPGRTTGEEPAPEPPKPSRVSFGLRNRLKSTVSKRAEKIASAGKSVLDNFGVDLEKQIQTTAQEFSQSASSEVRQIILDHLKSPEGNAQLAKIRWSLAQAWIQAAWTTHADDLSRLPQSDLDQFVATLLEHNRTRPAVRAVVDAEVEAWFRLEGPRSVRDLLTEAHLMPQLRAQMLKQLDPVAVEFLGSDGFKDWLADALSTPIDTP